MKRDEPKRFERGDKVIEKREKKMSFLIRLLLTLLSFSLLISLFIRYDVFNGKRNLYEKEKHQSFQFLYDHTNLQEDSVAYGLISDRMTQKEMASIAAVGIGLAAYPIAVENEYLSYEEAEKIVQGTLNTLLHQLETYEGFFYHFMYLNSGRRYGKSEVSIIDTAMAVMGALLAGTYFGGEVEEQAMALFERINWPWYFDDEKGVFFMEYMPEEGKHTGEWAVYAEQMMLYLLSSQSENYPVEPGAYYRFQRQEENTELTRFIRSPINAHFVYQYSNAFIDFRDMFDLFGHNWHQNAISASVFSKQFAIETEDIFKTLGEDAWGLTAGDGLNGYSGLYGSDIHQPNDGSLSLTGMIASAPFVKEDVDKALLQLKKDRNLWHKDYGLIEGYNDLQGKRIYFDDIISINKGMNLLMLENAETGLLWQLANQNPVIQKGLKRLGFREDKVVAYWTENQSKHLTRLSDRHSENTFLLQLNQAIKNYDHLLMKGDGVYQIRLLDIDGKVLSSDQILLEKDVLKSQRLSSNQIDMIEVKVLEGSMPSYLSLQSKALSDKTLIQVNQKPYIGSKVYVYADLADQNEVIKAYGIETDDGKITWQKSPRFKIKDSLKKKQVRFKVKTEKNTVLDSKWHRVLLEKPKVSKKQADTIRKHAKLEVLDKQVQWLDGGDRVYTMDQKKDRTLIAAEKQGHPWSYAVKEVQLNHQKELEICYQSDQPWLLKVENKDHEALQEWTLAKQSKFNCQVLKFKDKKIQDHEKVKVLLFARPNEKWGEAKIEFVIRGLET